MTVAQAHPTPATPAPEIQEKLPVITWEKLPETYVLPDDPVDNVYQPAIAAALTESLQLAGRLPETAITPTNYGICATVDGQLVVKAPDWAYVPRIAVTRAEIDRSYTPNLQGDPLLLVLEFLSPTDGGEYSTKATYPPGKWFFYEQILQVPYYGIFEPISGDLAFYQLDATRRYREMLRDVEGHYWFPELDLALGARIGVRENREGYWLRWWDNTGQLLLLGSERVEEQNKQLEAERQKAEAERQRAERLTQQLRNLGIEPES
ncbi:MAG: Uma2 family endonuclease [Synechococcales cyanobacterium CRU_2_2]|nr:Uma2 family endonuclease [Synechococcales cyanobacterium CRU_2_2]